MNRVLTHWSVFALCLCPLACANESSSMTSDAGGDTPANCTRDLEVEAEWQVLDLCRSSGQLLSVQAVRHDDVWVTGASGQALHFDGCSWTTQDTGVEDDLWWVTVTEGTVFMAGENGTILLHVPAVGAAFNRMDAPTDVTLLGIYAATPQDAWAVGFTPTDLEGDSVILRYDGATWSQVDFPEGVSPKTDLFKVWGRGADDVYIVGRDGLILHYDGVSLSKVNAPDTDWVTVTGTDEGIVLVGGAQLGALATLKDGQLETVPLQNAPPLQGVCLGAGGQGVATGLYGTILQRQADGSWLKDLQAPLDLFSPAEPPVEGCTSIIPDYHACSIDELGGAYIVGGGFPSGLIDGTLLYHGPPVSQDGL